MSSVEKKMKPSLTLYTNSASRAVLVEWYLQELGLQAELVTVDIHVERDNRKPDYLKINPFGQVPTLKDGDFILTESGAIILYLAEKYGGVTDLEERATLAKWVLFANAQVATWAAKDFREWSGNNPMAAALTTLDEMLTDKDYLLGSFSAADVPMGSYLMYLVTWFGKDVDLSPYPSVIRYVKRLAERPGCSSTHVMVMEGVASLKAKDGAASADEPPAAQAE